MEDLHLVATLARGFGAGKRVTVELALVYSSRRAPGEAAAAGNTALGYGWTHSYNVFLYTYQGNIFRRGPAGRITQFIRIAGSSPVRYQPTAGYFETLVRNADGTYTLAYPDGTTEKFRTFPGCPYFFVSALYQMIERRDRNGNTTALAYDAAGRLMTITDQGGRTLTFTYDSANRIRTITDPLGRITQLTHSLAGSQLTRITDALGHSVTFAYDGQFRVIRKTEKNGAVYGYTYGAGIRKAEQLNSDGTRSPLVSLVNSSNWAINQALLARSFRTEYVPSTVTNTDPRGNTWTYDYDKNAYLTRVRGPGQPSAATFTYDPATLKVASYTDANGHTTRHEYDARGNLTKTTDALGYVTTYTHEPVYNQVTSVTDPKGRLTTYDYDARGNRRRATDPLSYVQSWTFEGHGNMLTATDRVGQTTLYAYDAADNQTRVIDALAGETAMTYDAVGNLLTRTDALGRTTNYTYDALNRVTAESDSLGAIRRITYDAVGDRVATTDALGRTMFLQYDLRRRLIKIIDPNGRATISSYDANGNRLSATDRNGHITRFTYDALNRRTETVDPLGNITRLTYDPVGNVLTQTDAQGHVTTFSYDSLDRWIRKTDALGYVVQVEYDGGGNGGCGTCGATPGSALVTKQTDGNGKVTYYKYDGLGRRTKEIRKQGDTADVIDGDDAVTTYAYNANGELVALTEPNGITTAYEYDALNRPTRVTNAAGDTLVHVYDRAGNVIRSLWPNGNVATMTYDARDRLVQVGDSLGNVATYSYDAAGNRLSEGDGNHHTTTYTYDHLNRLTSVTDALGHTASRQFDPEGNLIATIDREGRTTLHTYDPLNRRTVSTDALIGTTRYQYDAVGNVVAVTDANAHTTRYSYDALRRLIAEQFPDAAPNTRTFTYDAVKIVRRNDQRGQTTNYLYSDLYYLIQRSYSTGQADNFTYDRAGRMLTANRGGWVVAFSYDGANRVLQSTQNGTPIHFDYNIPGRTRQITYPGGRVVTEHFDVRKRRTQISEDGILTPLVQYTYDPANRVTTRVYRNGVAATYGYDDDNRIVSLEHMSGATRIAGFGTSFDKEGNRIFEQNLHDPGRSESYQHDGLNRLVDHRVGELAGPTIPAPVTRVAYELDAVGNWTRVTRNGLPENRTHNEANEITTIDGNALRHDPNGNLEEDTLYTYSYDEENRLAKITRKADASVVVTYLYDALGRRVQKIANATGVPTTTRYFHDDARPIEEQDEHGGTRATYVFGNYVDEILTMQRGGQTYYYHQNGLMSVAAVTDNTASPAERYSYDAYGAVSVFSGSGLPVAPNAWNTPHSQIGNPHLFTGRTADEEAGLYHFRARTHDPRTGRFLQRDPWRHWDARNLYAYVGNRPLRYTDPTGLAELCTEQKKTIKMMGYDEFDFPFKGSEPGLEQTVDMPSTTMGSLMDALGVAAEFYKAYHAAFDDHVKNAMDKARENALEACNKFCEPFECPDSDACCVGEIDSGKFKGKVHDKRKDTIIESAPGGWKPKTTDFQVAAEGTFNCTCKCERSWLRRAWDWYIDLM